MKRRIQLAIARRLIRAGWRMVGARVSIGVLTLPDGERFEL